MIGLTTNIFRLCDEGRESANKPNIHSKIRGRCLKLFNLVEKIEDYPKSEIEKDYDALKYLSYGQRTPEEKELIEKAYRVVSLADRNAQQRNLKKAMNGEPPEDMDSEEEEDYGKDEKPRDLTAEENEYLDSNRRPNIHPRIVGICNSIFAELYRKPEMYMSRVTSMLNTLSMLRFSSKTPEEKELVERVSEAIHKAHHYARWRSLQRAKHPNEQYEEDEKEVEKTPAQNEYDWTTPNSWDMPQAEEDQVPVIDWSQDTDPFVDNWAEPEPFDKTDNPALESQAYVNSWDEETDPFVNNWAEPEPFDKKETQSQGGVVVMVDNWAQAKKSEAQVHDFWLKLKATETIVSDLSEQLEAAKAREEQWMREKEELQRKSHSQEVELTQTADQLEERKKMVGLYWHMSRNLSRKLTFAENELYESETREAELRKDVKALKKRLQRYEPVTFAEKQPERPEAMRAQSSVPQSNLWTMEMYNHRMMLNEHKKKVAELIDFKKEIEEKLAQTTGDF